MGPESTALKTRVTTVRGTLTFEKTGGNSNLSCVVTILIMSCGHCRTVVCHKVTIRPILACKLIIVVNVWAGVHLPPRGIKSTSGTSTCYCVVFVC